MGRAFVHTAVAILSIGMVGELDAQKASGDRVEVVQMSTSQNKRVVSGSGDVDDTSFVKQMASQAIVQGQEVSADKSPVSFFVYSKSYQRGREPVGSIQLQPGSHATIDPTQLSAVGLRAKGSFLHLKKGSVAITKEPRSRGTFSLKTPHAKIAVKGTKLSVHSTHPETNHVAVISGQVAVGKGGDKGQAVKAGSVAAVTPASMAVSKKVPDWMAAHHLDMKFAPTPSEWLLRDSFFDGDKQGVKNTRISSVTRAGVRDDEGSWMAVSYKGAGGGWIRFGTSADESRRISDIRSYDYIAFRAKADQPLEVTLSLLLWPSELDNRANKVVSTEKKLSVKKKPEWHVFKIDDLGPLFWMQQEANGGSAKAIKDAFGRTDRLTHLSNVALSGKLAKGERLYVSSIRFLRDKPNSATLKGWE